MGVYFLEMLNWFYRDQQGKDSNHRDVEKVETLKL